MEIEQASQKARWFWTGAGLLLVVLECVVIYFQLWKHRPSAYSWRFYYVPVMLTLSVSSIGGLYFAAKNGKYGPVNEAEMARLSFITGFAVFFAYLTLFICIGELV